MPFPWTFPTCTSHTWLHAHLSIGSILNPECLYLRTNFESQNVLYLRTEEVFNRQSLLLMGRPNIIWGKNPCAWGNGLQNYHLKWWITTPLENTGGIPSPVSCPVSRYPIPFPKLSVPFLFSQKYRTNIEIRMAGKQDFFRPFSPYYQACIAV